MLNYIVVYRKNNAALSYSPKIYIPGRNVGLRFGL